MNMLINRINLGKKYFKVEILIAMVFFSILMLIFNLLNYYLIVKYPSLIRHYESIKGSTNLLARSIAAFTLCPFIEEALFRSILKPNNTSIKLFISALVVYPIYDFGICDNRILEYSIIIAVFAISYFTLTKLKFKKSITLSKQNTFILLIISSFIFGVLHVGYEYLIFDIRTLFYIFFPMISGLIWGIARLKYGLKYSVLLHCLNNAVIAVVFL